MKTLAVLMLIALATTAQATVIRFNGTITGVGGTVPLMPQVGDPFRGTLVFDRNQPFNEDGTLNGSLNFFIDTMLGTFHTALEPVYSFSFPGFGPSVVGESSTAINEVLFISFLNAELSSFEAGVTFFDGCVGCFPIIGGVTASGIATIPETASTFTLFALSFAGVAMLLWIRRRREDQRITNSGL